MTHEDAPRNPEIDSCSSERSTQGRGEHGLQSHRSRGQGPRRLIQEQPGVETAWSIRDVMTRTDTPETCQRRVPLTVATSLGNAVPKTVFGRVEPTQQRLPEQERGGEAGTGDSAFDHDGSRWGDANPKTLVHALTGPDHPIAVPCQQGLPMRVHGDALSHVVEDTAQGDSRPGGTGVESPRDSLRGRVCSRRGNTDRERVSGDQIRQVRSRKIRVNQETRRCVRTQPRIGLGTAVDTATGTERCALVGRQLVAGSGVRIERQDRHRREHVSRPRQAGQRGRQNIKNKSAEVDQ